MKFFKIVLPLVLLGGAILLAKYLISTGTKPKKKPFVARIPVVEVMPLTLEDYTLTVEASGLVKAGRQTNLISEVSGRVLSLSDNFQEGAYIEKGETLLTIDKENYEISLAIVKSEVAGNRAALLQLKVEEKSNKRSFALAQTNLKLGKKEVSRLQHLFNKKIIARSALDNEQQKVNQLEQKSQDLQGRLNSYKSRRLATQAKLNATLAREKKEHLNISRTLIKAPYSGRILEKKVDIGQFVGMGTALGKIIATDYVDVELPLSLSRFELLDIPEVIRNEPIDKMKYPKVSFSSITSNNQNTSVNQWQGRIARTRVALDQNSRQITVIARIENPFDSKNARTPIRIGQYVKAKIKGKKLRNVFVLPPIGVRQNKEILLLNEGEVLVIPVKTLWNNFQETVVETSVEIEGKNLIITPMNQATTGMKAISIEDQKKKDLARSKENNKQDKKSVENHKDKS